MQPRLPPTGKAHRRPVLGRVPAINSWTCDVVLYYGQMCGYAAKSPAGLANHKRTHGEPMIPAAGSESGRSFPSLGVAADSLEPGPSVSHGLAPQLPPRSRSSPPALDQLHTLDRVQGRFDYGGAETYYEDGGAAGADDDTTTSVDGAGDDDSEPASGGQDVHLPPAWLQVFGPKQLDVGELCRTGRRARKLTRFQRAFANWSLQAGVSEEELDNLLAMLHGARQHDVDSLPRRARTLIHRVDAAVDLLLDPAGLQSHTLVLSTGVKVRVQFRDLWAVVKSDFMEDEELAGQLHFSFNRCFDASSRERTYGEMWTGEWWECVQRRPEAAGRSIVAIILHIDDTPVAGKSLTPVNVTVGNLPMAVRRTQGAVRAFAYIPALEGNERERNTENFRQMRRELLHTVISFLLEPLRRVHDKGGDPAMVHGVPCTLLPYLALVVADNDEKARLALCFGKHNSELPCYACLVPACDLGDTIRTSTRPYPARTAAGTKYLLREYAELTTTTERLEFRRKHSMHFDVRNAFFDLPGDFDVYTSMPPEALHDLDLGIVRWSTLNMLKFLAEHDSAAIRILDERLRALTRPPIHGVKSFGPAGFTGLQRHEGAHFRALVQLLPVALSDLSEAEDFHRIVDLFERLHTLYVLARRSQITQSSLDAWQVAACAWTGDFQQLLGRYMGSDGAFPKLHAWLGGHLTSAIKRYGAPGNFDSSAFEKAHIFNVKRHAGNVSRAHELAAQIAMRASRAANAADLVRRDQSTGMDGLTGTGARQQRPALAILGSVDAQRDADVASYDLHGQRPAMPWRALAAVVGMPMERLGQLLRAGLDVVVGDENDILQPYNRLRLPSGELAYARLPATLAGRVALPTRTAPGDARGDFPGDAVESERQDFVELLRPDNERGGLPWIARLHAVVSVVGGPARSRVVAVVRWLHLTDASSRARLSKARRTQHPASFGTAAADIPGQPSLLLRGSIGEWDLRDVDQLVRRVAVTPAWQARTADSTNIEQWLVNLYVFEHGYEPLESVADLDDTGDVE
jgi:hypothetical protein